MKQVYYATLSFLIWTLFCMALLTERHIAQVIQTEQASVRAALGDATADHVLLRTDMVFGALFVDTKVMPSLHRAILPQEDSNGDPFKGMGDGGGIWKIVGERLAVLFAMVYHVIYRGVLAMHWWAFSLTLLFAAFLDGYWLRRIRQTNFTYASPSRHRLGLYMATAVIAGSVIMLFLPIALSPWATPVGIVLIAGAVHMFTANLIKRV